MKLTIPICSSAALAAVALASVRLAPRDAQHQRVSTCNPASPIEFEIASLEVDQDPLASDVLGLVGVHVGASTDLEDAAVSVSCTSSEGVALQEAADFVDEGAGKDLLLEKLDREPQWLLVRATVELESGESFSDYRFFGVAPQPVIEGATEIDGVVYLAGEQH
jgi:hypothetical protein